MAFGPVFKCNNTRLLLLSIDLFSFPCWWGKLIPSAMLQVILCFNNRPQDLRPCRVRLGL